MSCEYTSSHYIRISEMRESAKHTKYKELENDYWFIPICVETLGSWGPEGFKFIREVS